MRKKPPENSYSDLLRRMKTSPQHYNALIGNSRLLCILDRKGEPVRLFWPNIDYGQHIESFKLGIRSGVRSEPLWLGSPGWSFNQSYAGASNIVITAGVNARAGLSMQSTAFAATDKDAIVFRFQIANLKHAREISVVLYAILRIDESRYYNTALFDSGSQTLIFYRREVAIAARAEARIAYAHCGIAGSPGSAFRRKGSAKTPAHIQYKNPDAMIEWQLGRVEAGGKVDFDFYIVCGRGPRAALRRTDEIFRSGERGRLQSDAEQYWKDWLDRGAAHRASRSIGHSRSRLLAKASKLASRLSHLRDPAAPGSGQRSDEEGVLPALTRALGTKASEQYQRSLLALKLLCDRETGAIIAAPEFDRERIACGGYGYCWGRDAAFVAYALDLAGMTEEAASFFDYASRTQEESGVWFHRSYSSGELAPSWGLIQIDETGSILWAADQHWKMTGDRDFLERHKEMIIRGADYLARRLDRNGLPEPSIEPWEEEFCQGIFSAAAVAGGLLAASESARAMGRSGDGEAWKRAAGRVHRAIQRRLWLGSRGTYAKSLKPAAARTLRPGGRAALLPMQSFQESERPLSGGSGILDRRIDSSQLGLAFPFQIIRAADSRMLQAARSVRSRLWCPEVGGILRYEDDRYVGGNPWILTTLWLAIVYCQAGLTEEALELVGWAISHATETGLLTEQVDKQTGQPIWAAPLAWSHAMYVIAALKLEESLARID